MAGLIERIAAAFRGDEKARTPAPERTPSIKLSSAPAGMPTTPMDNPAEQARHYSGWPYSAIRIVSQKVASAEVKVLWRLPSGETKAVPEDHPAKVLLRHFNPVDTKWEAWCSTITSLLLSGNAYWLLLKNRLGTPAQIWPLLPQFVRVIPGETTLIAGYTYTVGARVLRFDASEIIHFRLSHSESTLYGKGPLQAAGAAVDTAESIAASQTAAFRQGVQSGVAFTSDKELSPETLTRLETQINAKYAGENGAGRPIILGGGLKVAAFGNAPKEMDWLTSSKATRDAILATFGVPAATLGISEDISRAAGESMDRILLRYTVKPLCRFFEERLSQDLGPEFDDSLFFTMTVAEPEDREQERKDMESRVRLGVSTINEERNRRGLAAVPWGDVPMTYQPTSPRQGASWKRLSGRNR